jgi:PAS domain S-box-containing protein
MSEPGSRSVHDVGLFLREARHQASENSARLEALAARRAAAAKRLASRGSGGSDQFDLIEELTVRDEELLAVTEELREQIEAMKRASALLERERSKYINLFAHAPDAYIVTNLAGVVDEANIAAGALFRAEPASLTGRALITYVARQDTRMFRSLLRKLQAADHVSTESPHRAVLRMRPRGQPVFVVSARVSVVTNGNGKPLALRWVLRDVDLEEADAGRGAGIAAFAEAITDDLRAPLGPIATWVHSLREWGELDEEARATALSSIEKSASLQRAKLDQLAELAQVHAQIDGLHQEPHTEPETTDLVEHANRAAEARHRDAGIDRLVVRCKVAPGGAKIPAPGALRAIELLLQRALDGTPRAETIDVHVGVDGPDAFLEINAPEGARIPDNWEVRTATATRIVERCGGRVVLHERSPSVRLRWQRTST